MTKAEFTANREANLRLAQGRVQVVQHAKPEIKVYATNQAGIYAEPVKTEQLSPEHIALLAELRELEASIPKTAKQIKAEKKAKRFQRKLDKFRRDMQGKSINRYEIRCCA